MQSLPDVAKANGEMEALQKQKENDVDDGGGDEEIEWLLRVA